MNIPLIIVGLYIVFLFGVSFYARRRAKGTEGFVLAGRSLTTPLIAVSVTGLAIGGASTIGVSEQAYKVGMAAGWYNVAWGVGAILMGLVAAAKYRRLNITTVPEMFEKFYDVKGRFICVLSQITISLVVTSLQYIAGGAILASLLPSIFTLKSGMITSAVVFIGITFVGGMLSAGLSNLLNVALIYVGIALATIIAVTHQGGVGNIAVQLPQNVPYFHLIDGLGWIAIASWFAVMVTQCFSAQGIVQIACSAKDEKAARNGFILGGLIIIPIGFLSALMGIAAKTMFPDMSATLALPQMIMSLNPIIAGITLAALWAADVSTAGSMLLGSATLFSQDIYKRFLRPDSDEKRLTFVTRLSVMVLGILTFVMALTVKGILSTIMIGLSLTAAFTIIFLFTVFAPGFARKSSAFYTTLVGAVVLVLWQLVPAIRVFPHVVYLEWITCLITFLLVPLFDSRRISVKGEFSQGTQGIMKQMAK